MKVQITSDDLVAKAEAEFVLQAFEELKQIYRSAELKITVDIDTVSGQPEIIYAGFQKKKSLETVRKVYQARRNQTAVAAR